MIYYIFTISTILIIWFNTDAFVEYVKLLGLPFFKVKEYIKNKESDISLSYHAFLLINHNNFFTRLITCPICTSMWLTIIAWSILDISFLTIPIIFILSNIIYFIFTKLSP